MTIWQTCCSPLKFGHIDARDERGHPKAVSSMCSALLEVIFLQRAGMCSAARGVAGRNQANINWSNEGYDSVINALPRCKVPKKQGWTGQLWQ